MIPLIYPRVYGMEEWKTGGSRGRLEADCSHVISLQDARSAGTFTLRARVFRLDVASPHLLPPQPYISSTRPLTTLNTPPPYSDCDFNFPPESQRAICSQSSPSPALKQALFCDLPRHTLIEDPRRGRRKVAEQDG